LKASPLLTRSKSDEGALFRITVENTDYHHPSHSEIDGGKRIINIHLTLPDESIKGNFRIADNQGITSANRDANGSLLRKRMFRQSGLLPILREPRRKWLQALRQFREGISTAFTDSGSLNTDAETRLLRLGLAVRPLKAACVFASSNTENT